MQGRGQASTCPPASMYTPRAPADAPDVQACNHDLQWTSFFQRAAWVVPHHGCLHPVHIYRMQAACELPEAFRRRGINPLSACIVTDSSGACVSYRDEQVAWWCPSQGTSAQGSVEMAPVQFLPRWQPNGEALYHRRLGVQWHDMCAESLGMPKVALCFLTRGPVHQVRISCAALHGFPISKNWRQEGTLFFACLLLLTCPHTPSACHCQSQYQS